MKVQLSNLFVNRYEMKSKSWSMHQLYKKRDFLQIFLSTIQKR